MCSRVKSRQLDSMFDWFPQEENVPDEDHFISAYVVAPNGTIPYTNGNTAEPT